MSWNQLRSLRLWNLREQSNHHLIELGLGRGLLEEGFEEGAVRAVCDTLIYGAAGFYASGGERSQVGGDSFDDWDGDGN